MNILISDNLVMIMIFMISYDNLYYNLALDLLDPWNPNIWDLEQVLCPLERAIEKKEEGGCRGNLVSL